MTEDTAAVSPTSPTPSPSISRLRIFQTRAWRTFNELFDDRTFFGLIGAMTVLLVILHIDSIRGLREVILICCGAGIVDRRLLSTPAYWFVLTLLLLANHAVLWQTQDNHKYLQTYWCLAMGVSRLSLVNPAAVMLNARWLIGLCFLFATFWKLCSPEFLDGSFFHFVLLTDPRFSGFSNLVGGVPADVTAANIDALQRLMRPDSEVSIIQLADAPRIATLARFLSFWTVGIEALIAFFFLLPDRYRLSAARDLVLLVFMLSTYPVATVFGFGRLLAVMGLAQSRNYLSVERVLYLGCFLFLPLYEFPFVRLIRAVFG